MKTSPQKIPWTFCLKQCWAATVCNLLLGYGRRFGRARILDSALKSPLMRVMGFCYQL